MSNRQIHRDPLFTRNVWNCFLPDFSSLSLNMLHLRRALSPAPARCCLCSKAEPFTRVCSSLWLPRPCLLAFSRMCWSYFKVQLASWDHSLSSSGPKFWQWTVWVLLNLAVSFGFWQRALPPPRLLYPVALDLRLSPEVLQKDAVFSGDQHIISLIYLTCMKANFWNFVNEKPPLRCWHWVGWLPTSSYLHGTKAGSLCLLVLQCYVNFSQFQVPLWF